MGNLIWTGEGERYTAFVTRLTFLLIKISYSQCFCHAASHHLSFREADVYLALADDKFITGPNGDYDLFPRFLTIAGYLGDSQMMERFGKTRGYGF